VIQLSIQKKTNSHVGVSVSFRYRLTNQGRRYNIKSERQYLSVSELGTKKESNESGIYINLITKKQWQ
jgi:hypothetical protein